MLKSPSAILKSVLAREYTVVVVVRHIQIGKTNTFTYFITLDQIYSIFSSLINYVFREKQDAEPPASRSGGVLEQPEPQHGSSQHTQVKMNEDITSWPKRRRQQPVLGVFFLLIS